MEILETLTIVGSSVGVATFLYMIMRNFKKDLKEIIDQKIKQEIGGLRTEMKQEIGGLRTEMKQEFEHLRIETKQEFDHIKREIDLIVRFLSYANHANGNEKSKARKRSRKIVVKKEG